MEVLKEMVGTVVANDGASLKKALGVTQLQHIGNFLFSARLWGVEVDIVTEPVDEDAREIRVLSVRVDEAGLEREGIYRNKVGFCYHMQKGRVTAESYVELPVSAKVYAEFRTRTVEPESETHRAVAAILRNLTKLQGYDKLLGFDADFSAEEREGEDDD